MQRLTLIFTACIFFAWSISLFSCRKDRSMDVIITVKLFQDTTVLIQNARVELQQGDVKVVGYTNGYGEFRYNFELPMLVNVDVAKDTLKGEGVLRIGDFGTEVKQTIYVF